MLPGAPVGNIQPHTQITARREVSGDGKAGQPHFSLLGKACPPKQVFISNFTPPTASTPPAGDDPKFLPPPLLPVLSPRLHVSQRPKPGLNTTQNQSMSQKEECRCDKLRDGLLIQLPRKLLSLEAFHISGALVLSIHKSSGHTGHHYYCCCYFHQ